MNARRCLVPYCAASPEGAADLCPLHEVQREVPALQTWPRRANHATPPRYKQPRKRRQHRTR